MANRPSAYPLWTDGDVSKVVQPPSNFALAGWLIGQAPPNTYMNWEMWMYGNWIAYLDSVVNIGTPDHSIRLINGGILSFVASSGVFAWSANMNLSIPEIPDSDNQIAAGNATLADGQVAYVTANIPLLTDGNLTSGSNQVTNISFPDGIVNGMNVTGTGIPGGTTVAGVSGSTVTLSANATFTGASTLTFASSSALTVQVATNSAFVPSINTVMIARRIGALLQVGVNAGQMLLRDGESKAILDAGYLITLPVTAGENLAANDAIYLSNGSDGGRTAGDAYKADASSANGGLRSQIVGLVIRAATTSNPALAVAGGLMGGFSSLVPGKTYYVDPGTPGGITAAKPSTLNQWVIPVGIAVSTTQLFLNAGLSASVNQVGSGGGGGATSANIYLPDSGAAIEGQLNGTSYVEYGEDDTQAALIEVVVGDDYASGIPIKLKGGIFASGATTGNVLFIATSYLQRTGTDILGSLTNSHVSTNTAVNVAGSANVLTDVGDIDITDGSGQINGVSVSPGDTILVSLVRSDTDTAASYARLLKYSLAPMFG